MDRPDLNPINDTQDPRELAAAWGLDMDADLDEISYETQRFFGGGQCHALAAACAEELGMDAERVRIVGTTDGKFRVHMGVLLDGERVADIQGITDLDAFRQKWASSEIRIFDDADEAVIWAYSKGCANAATEVAEVYAPLVIDHWQVESFNQGHELP
jgi:hypothetical protein